MGYTAHETEILVASLVLRREDVAPAVHDTAAQSFTRVTSAHFSARSTKGIGAPVTKFVLPQSEQSLWRRSPQREQDCTPHRRQNDFPHAAVRCA